MSELADIGLVGLAVMGENLALNIESRGYRIAVFNRTTEKVDALLAGRAAGKNFIGCHSIEELVEKLASPRKIVLLVKAGPAVDAFIDQLIPLLSPGDIIIDSGNTHFSDTERRTEYVQQQGLLYIGTGISGGEEGALKGPSMMPGGSESAWPEVKEIFQAISAKVGPNDDIPCAEWVGPRGAGHYVKMVHNGIEYGDMQLICEAYQVLKDAVGLSNDELYDVFAEWNRGELQSYLVEITRDIFSVMDDQSDDYLVDRILDVAGAKGTGKWMSQLALDLGVPSTLVTAAVYARSLSAVKDARRRASDLLPGPSGSLELSGEEREEWIESVRQALYASKICSYAQGFVQLQAAAAEHDWPLNYGECALLWRGALFVPSSWTGSRRPLMISRTWRISYSIPTSRQLWRVPRRPGGMLSSPPRNWGFRCPLSAPPWPITMVIAGPSCRQTCCRRSETTSGRIRSSEPIRRGPFTRSGSSDAGRLLNSACRKFPGLISWAAG